MGYSPFVRGRGGGGGGGGGGDLFTCPYPLTVQVRPPRDQSPAIRVRVSGQEEKQGIFYIHNTTDMWSTGCNEE